MSDRPWSEVYGEAGRDWAEKEAAASLLEDAKSAVMAQRQAMLGDMPVNRAEQTVKASPDWMDYIEKTVAARKEANLAKVKMETVKMRYQEALNAEANLRLETRMAT